MEQTHYGHPRLDTGANLEYLQARRQMSIELFGDERDMPDSFWNLVMDAEVFRVEALTEDSAVLVYNDASRAGIRRDNDGWRFSERGGSGGTEGAYLSQA